MKSHAYLLNFNYWVLKLCILLKYSVTNSECMVYAKCVLMV